MNDTKAQCLGCGQTIDTHGYADVCDKCAATGNALPAVVQAAERNAYRNRFPDVPDERDWPTREEDDATLHAAAKLGVTLYRSNSYSVGANEYGVEITNMQTGDIRWLEGKRAIDARAGLEVIPPRVPADQIEAVTDHYLSQFFGAL